MDKPLLHRRTFWKGVAAGAAAMAALIMGSVVAVSLSAPKELSQGVRPTWEPTPIYASLSKPTHVTLPPCDTRGKDCVVFEEPTITFVPKLLGAAVVIAVSGNWMLASLVSFAQELYASVPALLQG